jgi:hypothetical protein
MIQIYIEEVLPSILRDPKEAARLFHMSQLMLSEEAVRCLVLIADMRGSGTTREDRERLRESYLRLIDDHLCESAPMPVDVDRRLRDEAEDMLTVSARRRVIFLDDMETTLKQLEDLWQALVPRCEQVFARFATDFETPRPDRPSTSPQHSPWGVGDNQCEEV